MFRRRCGRVISVPHYTRSRHGASKTGPPEQRWEAANKAVRLGSVSEPKTFFGRSVTFLDDVQEWDYRPRNTRDENAG